MGLDIYMQKGPVLSIKFNPDVTTEVKYSGCNNSDCKSYKKEIGSKFCSDCGNEITEISKFLTFMPEDVLKGTDLTVVKDNDDNELFHFYDYEICESKGNLFDYPEGTSFVKKDSLNDDCEHVTMFKEKYTELLNDLSGKGLPYNVEIAVFTMASY